MVCFCHLTFFSLTLGNFHNFTIFRNFWNRETNVCYFWLKTEKRFPLPSLRSVKNRHTPVNLQTNSHYLSLSYIHPAHLLNISINKKHQDLFFIWRKWARPWTFQHLYSRKSAVFASRSFLTFPFFATLFKMAVPAKGKNFKKINLVGAHLHVEDGFYLS